MHPELARRYIARVRKRVSEGDCPTEPPLSIENLEDLVLTLAEPVAWLIEHGGSPAHTPRYWAGSAPYARVSDPARSSSWTENHMQAIRFARRLDAERVASRFMGGIPTRICPHIAMRAAAIAKAEA